MLASRSFTMADQIRFATVSGDHNPMHIDVVFARRTQAGEPAVHGIHLLLWALDVLARANDGQPAIRRLTARFNRFVAVDEMVAAVPAKRNEANARFDLVVDILAAGLTVAQITVDYGRPAHGPNALFFTAVSAPADPYNLAFEEMEGLSGRLAFASAAEIGRGDVPGAVGLAGVAARRCTCGQLLAGWHGVPRATFHLWQPGR